MKEHIKKKFKQKMFQTKFIPHFILIISLVKLIVIPKKLLKSQKSYETRVWTLQRQNLKNKRTKEKKYSNKKYSKRYFLYFWTLSFFSQSWLQVQKNCQSRKKRTTPTICIKTHQKKGT